MKIAFLFTNTDFHRQTEGLFNDLQNLGCDCRVFPIVKFKSAPNVQVCNWHRFDFGPIDVFRPDRVLVFNGHQLDASASVSILRKKYPVFKVELGWLPQFGTLYMDTEMGHGGEMSKRAPWVLKKEIDPTMEDRGKIQELKNQYDLRDVSEFGKGYILVPLQLENDVSILKDSPYIKRMDNLISFLDKNTRKVPILVKHHPRDSITHHRQIESLFRNRGSRIVFPGGDYRTIDLAQNAGAVVGINSTTLVESHIFDSPITALGKSSFFNGRPDLMRGGDITKSLFEKTISHKSLLVYGLYNQWFKKDPTPDWVISKVLDYKLEPRFPY